MARSNEPLVWAAFSAGGVVAALLAPVTIFALGLSGPLGWSAVEQGLSYDRFRELVSPPIVRLVLFVIIVLPMFHWAHRFRFVLVDLGLRGLKTPIAVTCYGVAIAMTLVAAGIFLKL